jgi:hypothetical protein
LPKPIEKTFIEPLEKPVKKVVKEVKEGYQKILRRKG